MSSANLVDHWIEQSCLSARDLAESAGICEPELLFSRDEGAKFLQAVKRVLGDTKPGTMLVLDFGDIKVMDASFADEALVTLTLEMSRGEFKDKYIALKDLTKTSRENLEFAIFRRPDVEEKQVRNLALLSLQDGALNFVGKLEKHLKDPWDFVIRRTKTTARELSDALGMELSAASTKLKTLFDLRVIRREEIRDESGKTYIYSPLTET